MEATQAILELDSADLEQAMADGYFELDSWTAKEEDEDFDAAAAAATLPPQEQVDPSYWDAAGETGLFMETTAACFAAETEEGWVGIEEKSSIQIVLKIKDHGGMLDGIRGDPNAALRQMQIPLLDLEGVLPELEASSQQSSQVSLGEIPLFSHHLDEITAVAPPALLDLAMESGKNYVVEEDGDDRDGDGDGDGDGLVREVTATATRNYIFVDDHGDAGDAVVEQSYVVVEGGGDGGDCDGIVQFDEAEEEDVAENDYVPVEDEDEQLDDHPEMEAVYRVMVTEESSMISYAIVPLYDAVDSRIAPSAVKIEEFDPGDELQEIPEQGGDVQLVTSCVTDDARSSVEAGSTSAAEKINPRLDLDSDSEYTDSDSDLPKKIEQSMAASPRAESVVESCSLNTNTASSFGDTEFDSAYKPERDPITGRFKKRGSRSRSSSAKRRVRDQEPDRKRSSRSRKSARTRTGKQAEKIIERKPLPDSARTILAEWFDANPMDPYPTPDVKNDLINRTGLHPTQVESWLSHARARIRKRGLSRPI